MEEVERNYLENARLDGYLNGRLKRCCDMIGAIVGMLVFWPVLLCAILAIKILDPVPPIFRQERYGLDGVPFVMLKLRTLEVVETPDMLDSEKVLHKPRYKPTRTGRFLRVWSIDEFPQFWNVLKGEMSLVGHRPFPYYYVPFLYQMPDTEAEEINEYLSVISSYKPGITSLSTIRGRSNLSTKEKMGLDVEYAKEADLLYDAHIIAVTLKVLITREGAR